MYQPPVRILKRYADVLVNFALNSGKGLKAGEVVYCVVPDLARPLYGPLLEAILRAGGQPVMRLVATGFEKQFFQLANDEQLKFFPKNYLKARVKLIDHSIGILAERDLHELEDVVPEKIVMSSEAKKPLKEWMMAKEYAGKFTWTLGLYGTEVMAKEVGLSLEAYWQQIIKACYLDHQKPISVWQQISAKQNKIKDYLDHLGIKKIEIKSYRTNLCLDLGADRRFVGGGGRNIPSFEIFTSPDWRGTEGIIYFNQPVYRFGQLIEGIELNFRRGVVVSSRARKGEKLLKEILKRPNANKVGEFSLTDGTMSRITHFMANTLYDENMGGKNGNMHLAVGMAYKDAYAGEVTKLKRSEWKRLGFNDSGEHMDIVSTMDREVKATLASGGEKVIYQKGRFMID